MWNGAPDATLNFDLGKTYRVSGIYLWNYNEGNGYNRRGVREVDSRQLQWMTKNSFRSANSRLQWLRERTITRGRRMPFAKPVSARYFRWKILSNYGGGDASGISEVRFANADAKAVVHVPVHCRLETEICAACYTRN